MLASILHESNFKLKAFDFNTFKKTKLILN